MILVEEMIQRVQSLYSKGVQSKDTRLTPRHIYSCVLSARTLVLQQKSNKRQFISEWNYQTLPSVKLIESPLHDVPCAPTGMILLRSEHKLPRPITNADEALIDFVTTIDNSISFDRKNYRSSKHAKGRKFTADKPYYFIKNEYLYLGSIKKINAVTVIGLFHDPYEAYIFPRFCEGDDCDCQCKSPFEIEFPIDGDYLKAITDIASQEAIYLFKQMTEDTSSDATDNNNTKGAMIHQPD